MKQAFWLVLVITLSSLLPVSADAQLFGLGDEDPAPAEELPAIPEVEETGGDTQQQASVNGGVMGFPQLPPSRLCTKRDIMGMWKMVMLFQEPPGVELEDFGSYPYQYALFNNNDTFRIYKSATGENTELEVMKILQDPNNRVLEQFVLADVSDASVLYFYKDGVVYDNMACFVVVDPVQPFAEGHMLLMPPPERAHIRMVKVYQKVYSAPKPANKRKNRKNRRRRQ